MFRSAEATGVRFVGISLDCADPAELAMFYLNLLGGHLVWTNDGTQ